MDYQQPTYDVTFMRLKLAAALFTAMFWFTSVVTAEEIPNLDLRTMQGESQDLDHWVGKGKWVLVMFWALNCHVCETNKPAIIEFHKKHKNNDAVVVGVSIDGMDQLAAIEGKLKGAPFGFPNYVAELGIMAMNYEIAAEETFRGTPTYWLFSPDGELKAVQPGPVQIEALETYMARFTQL